jgi:hypothetical protein
MLTMHPEERRRVARLLGEMEAEEGVRNFEIDSGPSPGRRADRNVGWSTSSASAPGVGLEPTTYGLTVLP